MNILEKWKNSGKQSLNDVELLSIFLEEPVQEGLALYYADAVFREVKQDYQQLSKLHYLDLLEVHGIPEKSAIKLMAAFELARRIRSAPIKQLGSIRHSRDVYELLHVHLAGLRHEEFFVIYLNFNNEIISVQQLSIGGMHSTIADGKRIFQQALRCHASGLILSHNHPSGQLKPSSHDKTLTMELRDFAKLIDMKVLDHVIFTDNGYFSFADEGLL
ncbi:MAG: hypothetical protein RLZZ301_870 [Bacteroidota bacterium]|jgi:DNA repair protein RadC